jgi:hypothetical protein
MSNKFFGSEHHRNIACTILHINESLTGCNLMLLLHCPWQATLASQRACFKILSTEEDHYDATKCDDSRFHVVHFLSPALEHFPI